MKKKLLGLCLAIVATILYAGPLTHAESSTIVRGTIVLSRKGTVQAVAVDDEARYGKPIVDLVRDAAKKWRFYPVIRNGKPVVARSSMYVRVVLSKNTDGNFTARIKGATFGDMSSTSTESVHNAEINKHHPPSYPVEAIRAHVQGTVYLALRVDRSGHVIDAVVEQVNLENYGAESMLNRYRKLMAKASLDAARRWQYVVPTTGPLAAQRSWTVHVPIHYGLNDSPGKDVWETYIPGPYTQPYWNDKQDMDTADIVSAGGVLTDGAGPKLRSP